MPSVSPAALAGATAVVAVVACAGPATPDAGDAASRLAIAVAPLELAGVTDATFNLRVRNAEDVLVWEGRALTSSSFGDGAGALSYVGPCDATTNPNRVELELVDLAGPAPGTWVNPAPPGAPVTVAATCADNADTPVNFDLTIARSAQQGFFDIGVDFDDVFCSAKLDCVDSAGDPLLLLHDASGARAQTAVVGLACTAGGDQPTTLYRSDLTVTCADGVTYSVSPTAGHGNTGAHLPGLFQSAVYAGREDLPGVDMCYWNMALGLDLAGLGPDCRLTATATATSTPFPGGAIPEGHVWPVITWDAPLTDASGALACGRSPLDGGDGVVATAYSAGAGVTFPRQLACASGAFGDPGALACPAGTTDVDGTGTVCAPPAEPVASAVVVPYAATRPPSDLFLVTVDDGYEVHDLPVEARINVGHVHFAFSGTVEVSVTYLEPHLLDVGDLVVRPRRFAPPYTVSQDGLTATFTLDRPQKLAIEGERFIPETSALAGPSAEVPWGKPVLWVFASSLEPDPIDPGAPNVVVPSGPGVDPTGATSSAHAVGTQLNEASPGDTFYLGPGIYLTGTLRPPQGVNLYLHPDARVRLRDQTQMGGVAMLEPRGDNYIHGRGTVDARGIEYYFAHEDFGLPGINFMRLIRAQSVDDVDIDGLVMVDQGGFGIWLEGCERWTMRDIKNLEYGKWDAWAPRDDDPTPALNLDSRKWGAGFDGIDGVHVDASRRVLMSDSAIFAADSNFIVSTANNTHQRFMGPYGYDLFDITARSSVLYNHAGGQGPSISFWNGSNHFHDITFENLAIPDAYNTLHLRAVRDSYARIERVTWAGVDFEQSRWNGRLGHLYSGEILNDIRQSNHRIHLKFRLDTPGTYDQVLLELPQRAVGAEGSTLNVHESSNTLADGVTPWTERYPNPIGWNNQPPVGATLASFGTSAATIPWLRSPVHEGRSFKVSGAAIRDYVQAHVDDGWVSFVLTVTPGPNGTGIWRIFNDEAFAAWFRKIALRVRVDGGETTWLYPSDDAVVRQGATHPIAQEEMPRFDMVDLVVKDVTLAGDGVQFYQLDGRTQIRFDDVYLNGVRRTTLGSVRAEPSVTRRPLEVTFSSTLDPVVEVVASAPVAEEGGSPGEVRLVRTGDTESPLRVRLRVAGSAKNGVDIAAVPEVFDLAPGVTELPIPIVALSDGLLEPAESVTVEVINVHRAEAEAADEVHYIVGPRYLAQVLVPSREFLAPVEHAVVTDSGASAPAGALVLDDARTLVLRFDVPSLPSLARPRYATLELPLVGAVLAPPRSVRVTGVAEALEDAGPWTAGQLTRDTIPPDTTSPLTLALPGEIVTNDQGQLVLIARDPELTAWMSGAAGGSVSVRVDVDGTATAFGTPTLAFSVVDR